MNATDVAKVNKFYFRNNKKHVIIQTSYRTSINDNRKTMMRVKNIDFQKRQDRINHICCLIRNKYEEEVKPSLLFQWIGFTISQTLHSLRQDRINHICYLIRKEVKPSLLFEMIGLTIS